MNRTSWHLCAAFVLWFCIVPGSHASNGGETQATTAPPIAAADLATIESRILPRLDFVRIAREDQAKSVKNDDGGWRFAIPSDFDLTPLSAGSWKAHADGSSQWRLHIVAADAVHLNFGFGRFRLPDGAQLTIQRPDGKQAIGPFTSAQQTPSGQLWTPILVGDSAVLVVDVATALRDQVDLQLSRIGQGYRGFGYSSSGYKSGSCNMDVACLGASDTWNNPRGSAGAYTKGGTDTCTGSLVNNTNSDRRLLFATAAHCTVTAANVASVLVYWRYENPICRQPGSAESGTPIAKPASTSAGLTWLASTNNPFAGSGVGNTRSDWTLFELAAPTGPDVELFWAGWDRRGVGTAITTCAVPLPAGTQTDGLCAGIHHPGVDEKRITFVNGDFTVGNISSATDVHWHSFWAVNPPILPNLPVQTTPAPGVTEPGSSGSPLYSAQKRLIGVLSGGPSACGATGANLSDYYGALFHSWEGVGVGASCSLTPPLATTCMRPHLDPAGGNPEFIDGVGECTPPTAPTGVSATPNGNNRIDVSWTAVAGAELYRVYRSNGVCPGSGFTQIAEVATTTHSDLAVSGGSAYSYRVTAVDTTQPMACESVQSTCADGLATGVCLLPPSFAGAGAVQSSGTEACGLDVQWITGASNCPGPAPTYSVYRGSVSGFVPSPANRLANCLSATSFHDSGVDYGSNYFYVVRAEDGSTDGSGSCNLGNVETNLIERSGTPTGLVSTSTLTETFEDASGFDNPGWTHQAISGATDWVWSVAQSQTPTHSWNSVSLNSVSQRVLVSPSFGAVANTALSFFHTYRFEGTTTTCYDGGTLEVSTDGGGTWAVVPDLAFTAGGFTGTVNSAYSNPIGGRRAWCSGTIGAMTQVTVDLGSYAGQTLQLRWNEGDDSSAIGTGWFVDSVTISDAGVAGVCTTGPSPLIFLDGFE